MSNGRLEGMVALVTGAGGGEAGGIGAGIARCLAGEGARVAINDLTADHASKTVQQLQAMGAEAWPVLGDVSDPNQASAMVSATADHFGRLDVLVNNAGIRRPASVERATDEQWLQVIGTNLNGPFFTSRAAVPVMRTQGFGRIINISSLAGILLSVVSGASYTASKNALIGLTRHLAAEVAQYGITVNAVLPGMTLTPAMRSMSDEETRAEMARTVPAQRIGTPEGVGHLVLFLASRESAYVTGTATPVDGGESLLPGDFSKGFRYQV